MSSLDNPKVLVTILILFGIGYGSWTFYQNSQSRNPHWQIDRMNSRNFPPHRVNVWSAPHPPTAGEITVIVEYDFVNLMNSEVGTVNLTLEKADGTRQKSSTASYRTSGRHRERYTASFTIEEPGKWDMGINTNWEGKTSKSTLQIQVDDKY